MQALAKFVGIIKADIERERKGRAGVENLAKALQVGGGTNIRKLIEKKTKCCAKIKLPSQKSNFQCLQETPKFGGEESQADVQDKLQHMRSMMTYLEASK